MIFLKEMVESDLPFFSEVRNECAIEFLHDSRLFTIEESIQWFRTTNPNYYIIEYNNKKIGYFRTSNHNPEENSIYIGCDIHTDYRGKGLAYESYLKFIPFISKKLNIKTINLEVLSTNTIAKNLYKKLGFVFNPDKSKTILKNDDEILSEFWSLKNVESFLSQTYQNIEMVISDHKVNMEKVQKVVNIIRNKQPYEKIC
jgi:RimJ/RimL family protein N-acetyltransferase